MLKDLITLRENIMNRVDSIVAANWPTRKGIKYRTEMMEVLGELKTIASEMKIQNYAKIEQSRIYRYIGSIC